MELQYHQKVLELLGVTPSAIDVPDSVLEFETRYDVRLPAALREWHLIDPRLELLRQILVSHHPVTLADAFASYAYYATPFAFLERVPLFLENQGVCSMAVSMFEGDDPPVYARYNEDHRPWKLTARSFSEWVYAMAWDWLIVERANNWPNGVASLESAAALEEFSTSEWQKDAPETWYVDQFFVEHRFLRVRRDGERKLVIVPGEKLHE